MSTIRLCRPDERAEILAIVNSAAEAYRGVIPTDCWHEPYMPTRQLDDEITAGIGFWGYEKGGALVGVMGIRSIQDVDLIRHACVLPGHQREGVGAALLTHLRGLTRRPILIGTWADATWAIRFYERNGFALVSEPRKTSLLKTYWSIPERQAEVSVVLAGPALPRFDVA
jgi:GNAT superfamily N-acetyltransferase